MQISVKQGYTDLLRYAILGIVCTFFYNREKGFLGRLPLHVSTETSVFLLFQALFETLFLSYIYSK